MPAGRIEKSRITKDVPDLGNPDRKRVLNVLAQRRYRMYSDVLFQWQVITQCVGQRRKEKVAALEAQAYGLEVPVDASSEDGSASQDSTTLASLVDISGEDGMTSNSPGASLGMGLVHDFGDTSWDLPPSGLDDILFSGVQDLPTPLPSTPDLVDPRGVSQSNGTSFPLTADGGVLAVPLLSALRAFISIATTLNVADHLWDPSYLHVMPASTSSLVSIPANLRPVAAQLVVPHHPSLDLLPWPSMREKLICMFAMPSKLRPPIAREENEDDADANFLGLFSDDLCGSSSVAPQGQSKAIVRLVQDLEDLQDGIRVHGNTTEWGLGNEFVEEAWEVGEVFYSKWWWCFDQKIIEQSNKRRRERGLRRLRINI